MNTIQYKYVLFAFGCLIWFCCCLGAALFNQLLLIPGALGLLGYWYLDKKRLRCPNCGGFLNLDKLFYAKKHECHCTHCGVLIEME